MLKNIKFYALAIGVMALPALSSCSDDDNDGGSDIPGYSKVGEITFENTNIVLAGPTSSGQNLYSEYSEGTKFISGSISFNKGADAISFGLNTQGQWYPNIPTLYNGGMFLSQFNLRSNPDTETGDWWYSYNNQCSVYNTDSTDGANKGAGDDHSNTFAIVNGWCNDSEISQVYGSGKEVGLGGFHFDNNAEFLIGEIEVCNTSYVYGSIINGNSFTTPLPESNGWFKVLAYGYDAEGKITNGGRPVEYVICNYGSNSPRKIIDDDWEDWNLSQLGEVNRIVFNFIGSDTGEYGLNTPAYIALDNIEIYAKKN